MTDSRLEGKTALVTGAARGIGEAIALDLAAHGANVILCDVVPEKDSEGLADKIREKANKSLYVRTDVGKRAEVERLFAIAVQHFGHLDILVNNAAINIRKPLIELEVKDVEKVWAASLWGVFHCTQLAARHMVARGKGGNIVSISSVHAAYGYPLSTAYNGAKAAVNHMSRTWAAELASSGIRVNVVEPGWIETPGELQTISREQLAESGKKLPLGRLGRPDEIARAVSFLVSAEGSYITGTCLRVDGGYVLPR